MELKSRIKKVPITDPETDETTYHYIERFDAPSLTRYRRALSKSATVKRGGQKIDVQEVKVKLEAWGRQIQKVEGYTVDGQELMETDKWKSTLVQLAPDHCLVAFETISSVFSEYDDDPDSDDDDDETEAGPEVNFPKGNSQDASAEE